jgi:hypothetical protein
MNYQRIHDNIINRAKTRTLPKKTYAEKHHIIPKCEGGSEKGETVKLTLKEHRLIHLLRYKITGVFGNIAAHNWMTQPAEVKRNNSREASRLSHVKMKERDYAGYIEKQRKSGILGGISSRDNKKGFYALTEEELIEARRKGTKTIVENKLGMFSDAYREAHKKILYKKINTPDGIFNSMMEAANFYNVVPGTITYRVNNNSKIWSNWFYIKENVCE